MLRKRFLYIALSFLLWGCAAAPPPSQELLSARTAVARAYAVGANQLAPTEYQAASAALADGEELVRRGTHQQAGETLPLAEAHAQRAILKARQQQDDLERQRLRALEERAAAEAPAPPVEPQKAAPPPPPPAKPKPEPPPPPPEHYTVANGETLWTIAARKEIYVDALLWPLIYKANRDQIKDPRQIYPGQVLDIPRNVSRQEQEEARETARQSDIFPVELLMKSHSPNNQ